MKKILFAIFLFVLSLFVLTACGNNNEQGPSEADIAKILETFSIQDLTIEADGQAHTITVSGTYEGYEVKARGTVSYSEVGTYTITYVITKAGKDDVLKTLTATLTINPKDTTAEDVAACSLSDATVDYDGEAHTLTVAGLKPGYEAKPVGEVSFTEVGEHEVKYNIVKTGSTEVLRTLTATLTIVDENLDRAAEFVATMQRSTTEATGAAYDLVKQVPIDGQFYQITWSIELKDAADEGKVVVALSEDGTKWEVTVDEYSSNKVEYFLVAEVASPNGNKQTVKFGHYVPAYNPTSYAEWLEVCADPEQKDKLLAVKGYVIAIVGSGSSKGSIYFQDADGHGYYAYAPAVAPEGLALGDEIVVKGTGTVYGGQYEFNKGCTVSATGNKVTLGDLVVNDGTEAWSNASSNKDKALIPFQNALIKLEGCKMDTIADLYYYFTIGGVKYNIYDTYYFLEEAVRKANYSGGQWEAGKVFDVIGLVSCYSESYQIYPLFAETIYNVSLPVLADADAVALVKEALELGQVKFEENGELELPLVGYGEQVAISWASDNEAVVINGDKATITLGSEELKVKLTATLTAGEVTETKEFELELLAIADEAFVGEFVSEVKAGMFKLALVQANLGKTLYATGVLTDRNFLETTDKAANAADFEFIAVEGGFQIKVNNKYLEIFLNDKNKNQLRLADEPTCVWTTKQMGSFTLLVVTLGEGDNAAEYYLGTYNSYDTMSSSNISYINEENAGKTQFPAGLATLAPAIEEFKADEVKAGKFLLSLNQANLGKTLYATGVLTDRNFLETTDKAANAAEFELIAVEGGFQIKVNGKYLEIFLNDKNKNQLRLADEPTCVWTTKQMGSFTLLVVTLGEGDKAAEYYLGTYNNYDTMSSSNISYINEENAGKTQFPAQVGHLELIAAEFNAEEVAAGTFKLALEQANLGKTLYATGVLTDRNFLETTDKYANAADFELIAVEGGFQIKVNGKYLEIFLNDKNKNQLRLADEPTCVWTTKQMGSFTLLVVTLGEGDSAAEYYLGTYNSYDTMSSSNISYINEDNAGKTQFPAQVGHLGPKTAAEEQGQGEGGEGGEETPTNPTHAGTEADPFDVADAILVGSKLENGAYTDEKSYVKGVVNSVKSYDIKNEAQEVIGKDYNLVLKDGDNTLSISYALLSAEMAEPKVGDTVVVFGFIEKFNDKASMFPKDKNDSVNGEWPVVVLLEPKSEGGEGGEGGDTPATPTHAGTEADPFDVADAILVGSALENGTFADAKSYVKGVVNSVKSYDLKNEAQEVIGKDYNLVLKDGDNTFSVSYALLSAEMAEPQVGDTVVVFGFIQKFRDKASMYAKDTTNQETGEWPLVIALEAKPADPEPEPVAFELKATTDFTGLRVENSQNTQSGVLTGEELYNLFKNSLFSSIEVNSCVYAANETQGPNQFGLKLGKGGGAGEITFNLTNTVNEIKLSGFAWNASKLAHVVINGVEFDFVADDAAAERQFVVALEQPADKITISSSIYAVFTKLEVSLVEGGAVEPQPEPEPEPQPEPEPVESNYLVTNFAALKLSDSKNSNGYLSSEELMTLFNNELFSAIEAGEKVYAASESQGPGKNGLKLGTGSVAGTIEFTLTQAVSEIKLSGFAWGASKLAHVVINGVEFDFVADDATAERTFVVTLEQPADKITISSSIYAVFTKLEVTLAQEAE